MRKAFNRGAFSHLSEVFSLVTPFGVIGALGKQLGIFGKQFAESFWAELFPFLWLFRLFMAKSREKSDCDNAQIEGTTEN
jgi:hypothetical protein